MIAKRPLFFTFLRTALTVFVFMLFVSQLPRLYAEVLYSQAMNWVTSDLTQALFSNLNHSDVQEIADDLHLESDASVQAVSWIGFYLTTNIPSATSSIQFTVRFFRDEGGRPASAPWYETRVAADRSLYLQSRGQTIYKWRSDLPSPVPLSRGNTNWISILDSDSGTDVGFRWSMAGPIGIDYAWRFSNDGEWYAFHEQVHEKLAFELEGTVSSPGIVTQPESRTVSSGQAITFHVTASGTVPLNYQWRYNGTDILGATGRSLVIVDAQMKDSGVYTVRVSNESGAIVSSPATLDVEESSGGSVFFANISPGIIAPVFDTDGQSRLEGARYLAQLYAGPREDMLSPVGGAVPFLTETAAGYWLPCVRHIAGIAPGDVALVQARVWDSDSGPTFDQASVGGGKVGVSKVILITTGSTGVPPTPPPLLTGLESFRLQTGSGQFADHGSHDFLQRIPLIALLTPADSRYTIEASTNLLDWKPLFNATSEDRRIVFLDSGNFDQRFFRARLFAP